MLPFTFYRTVRVDCPVFIWRHTMKEEKIKVLALLPMELPKEIELDNTLEAMQKFVGGLIECITLSDTGSAVTLVCNDEGKLLGLPLNRPLWDGADVLAGPGFLAGCDSEGNLTSLPQSSMDFYKEKFRAFKPPEARHLLHHPCKYARVLGRCYSMQQGSLLFQG